MTVGPSNEHFYERAIYEIDYTVHDESIHDGKTCTDNIKDINCRSTNVYKTKMDDSANLSIVDNDIKDANI